MPTLAVNLPVYRKISVLKFTPGDQSTGDDDLRTCYDTVATLTDELGCFPELTSTHWRIHYEIRVKVDLVLYTRFNPRNNSRQFY